MLSHSVRAAKWLDEARRSFENEAFDASILAAYLAMFHSARSTLFLGGYREKSHACVARFLEEKYVRKGKLERKWVQLLDHHRELRHENQYDLSFFTTRKEAGKALESSTTFLKRMQRLLDSLIQ